MAKFMAQYQYKVPSILMIGEEVLKFEPIILAIDDGGQVTIYPPESNEHKQNDSWNADTIRIFFEIEVSKPISEREANEVVRKSDRDTQQILLKFLRLLRRKSKVPIALPTSLQFSASYQWEGWQPFGSVPLATAMMGTVFVASQDAGLTGERWRKLHEEMQMGMDTELWEDFVEDSKVALRDKDLNRATLYSAIACEIFIKEYIEKIAHVTNISSIFLKYLKKPETETKVLTYYSEILHLVIGHSLKDENIEMYKKLKLIFNARNKIMHYGKLPSNWNPTQINQLAESIKASESIISWVIGLDFKNHLKP